MFDHIFATILAALETGHDTIFVGPSCKVTKLVAFSVGLSTMQTEELTLTAPLIDIEFAIVDLFILNGWEVRTDNSGGYIARRNVAKRIARNRTRANTPQVSSHIGC